jgi:hypothetical protein
MGSIYEVPNSVRGISVSRFFGALKHDKTPGFWPCNCCFRDVVYDAARSRTDPPIGGGFVGLVGDGSAAAGEPVAASEVGSNNSALLRSIQRAVAEQSAGTSSGPSGG